MTALTSSLINLSWQRLAARAFAWWLAELEGLLPATLRSRLARSSAGIVRLEFSRDGASLLIPSRDRSAASNLPVSFDPADRISVTAPSIAGAQVQIHLDENLLFRPVVELPLAAEATLEPILRHQLERLVPLDPATLRFTWQVIERLPAKSRLKVEVCIVKQATIERATALARELGLAPRAVVVGNASNAAGTIWRAPITHHADRRERKIRRLFEILTIVFIIAAYGAYVWHLDAERTLLRNLAADVQARNRNVQALSLRAATAAGTLAEVESRFAAPSSLAVLDALTRALPLDSSVSELHLQDGKMDISGTASHATALLAALGSATLFVDPVFLAPIVAAGQGSGERYQLGFRVKRTPRP